MRVNVNKGELITDILYQHTGQDDDQVEAEFYRINPGVRGELFTADMAVTLPQPTHKQNLKTVNRSWD
ncbi:hypothetical protein [Photobacterium sp.]|uniref:hypothetical protein n=1 Tax=Photobacterium sp. TaxID=660 RepID=UPI00299F2778|nr:hypothetical protein [Photobacterium sp.]MDX1301834.1 hypothetical protein [Photobacterium sp.]